MKLSTLALTGLLATGSATAAEPLTESDLMTLGKLEQKCEVPNPEGRLTPAVDAFNQRLAGAATITPQEREENVREQDLAYLLKVQGEVSASMEKARYELGLWNYTEVPLSETEALSRRYDDRADPTSRLRTARAELLYAHGLLNELAGKSFYSNDKAIFEQDIAPALKTLNSVTGGNCTAEDVGPASLYPRSITLPSLPPAPLSSDWNNNPPTTSGTLADMVALGLDELETASAKAYAEFRSKYGLK